MRRTGSIAGSVSLAGHRLGQELLALTAHTGPDHARVRPAGVQLHAALRLREPVQGRGHQRSRALNDTLPR